MPAARFIVCEKKGHWAHAFRRVLHERNVDRPSPSFSMRVYETRSLQECWDELSLSPASFLALEATAANWEKVLEFLAQAAQRFVKSRAAVLGERGLEEYQWLMREAGAVHVMYSPRNLNLVLRMAERRLALFEEKPQTVVEEIYARMPWGP